MILSICWNLGMLNQIRSIRMIAIHLAGVGFIVNSDTFFRDSIKETHYLVCGAWNQAKEYLLTRLVGGTMAIQDLLGDVSKSQFFGVSRKTVLTFRR
jgi:hypothetical protein